MTKLFFRTIHLLLVSCLLLDPGWAACVVVSPTTAAFHSRPSFEQEALQNVGLWYLDKRFFERFRPVAPVGLNTTLDDHAANLEEWVASLVTPEHGLSSNLEEVRETLEDLRRLADSLSPSARTTPGRRHLYQTVVRALGLIAYETSQGGPDQQAEIVDLAMKHLTALGEIQPEQISWLKTLRNARRNLQRIKDGEIEVNLALLEIPDPEIVHDRNAARFIDNRNPNTLVGNLKHRLHMAMSVTDVHTGSGYGIFQTLAMIRKMFPKSRHEEAKRDRGGKGKIILNLLALSSGYGTRSGLLNVASFLDKGAIDLFNRTGMEQGLEQVLQLLGDPNLGKGLPPGEYFMVVPADNILLPDDNVAQYYQSGQGAFLYALRRPVVGVDSGALDAISEFGLVQVNAESLVAGFSEKPKRNRQPDRLKILQTVLGQSIKNYNNREGTQEEFYDRLWRLAEAKGAVGDVPYDDFRAARLELMVMPALLSHDVYFDLVNQEDRGWLKGHWSKGWEVGQRLLQEPAADAPAAVRAAHAEIIKLLQESEDEAYLNTFYFLMSRPFMDSLWDNFDGRELESSTSEHRKSFWRIPILHGKDSQAIDWSKLILQLVTLRGSKEQDTLPSPLDQIYSPADIKNLTLFGLQALKAGLTHPTFGEQKSQEAFMKHWNKRAASANTLRLRDYSWEQIGEACFRLLAGPQGTLFKMADLIRETHEADFTEAQYSGLKETALDVLQEIGARWKVVKFGSFWRDRGDPQTAWATLQDANDTGIIRQMVARLHFGLRLGLKDVSDDSVVEGDVRFLGQHTVNQSVIFAPKNGRVMIGDGFIANHSILDFRHLPEGSVITIASGVVVDHSDLPKEGYLKLAKASRSFIYRLYGDADMQNVPAYAQESVVSSLFLRRNGDTMPRAVSHPLLEAEKMRAELSQPLDGLPLGNHVTLQNIYDQRGALVNWDAQLTASRALDEKIARLSNEHAPTAAFDPAEAHGFAAVTALALSAALILHAPGWVSFLLLPWVIAAVGQQIAVIAHAIYAWNWRIFLSIHPIAVYNFNRQEESGVTTTFAHAHELARALLQAKGAIVPYLIAPLTLFVAVVDDLVAGSIESLPSKFLGAEQFRGASHPVPAWQTGLSFFESLRIGLRAVWWNSNARRASARLRKFSLEGAA